MIAPKLERILVALPANVTVLVRRHPTRRAWLLSTSYVTRDVRTGEREAFGCKRPFRRRPTKREIANAVAYHLRHEVFEQLRLPVRHGKKRRKARR